jgi:hypothetical protein
LKPASLQHDRFAQKISGTAVKGVSPEPHANRPPDRTSPTLGVLKKAVNTVICDHNNNLMIIFVAAFALCGRSIEKFLAINIHLYQ